MSVDVVVVSYNSGPHLARALASVGDPASVLVIDNRSSDDSVAVARSFGATVVANDQNLGFAAAANQGVALGTSELVLLLNPDAELGPDTLEVLGRALDDDPGLALVSPRIVHPDGREEQVWWPFPSAAGAWREALGLHRLGRRSGLPPDDPSPDNPSPDDPSPDDPSPDDPSTDERSTAKPSTDDRPGFVIGACLLMRRDRFEALGGFDTRFWLYAEESDLCRRLADDGWRVAVIDAAVATHVGGASSAGIETVTDEHFARGAELFVLKHSGRAALVSLRLAQVVGSSPRAIVVRDPGRRRWHRFRLTRAARLLATHPTRVPPAGGPTGPTGVEGGAR